MLTIAPKITKARKHIEVTTSMFVQIVLLGTLFRRVRISPSQRKLQISSRYFWFIRRKKTFKFQSIKQINYSHDDLLSGTEIFSAGARDGFDMFQVGLWLSDNRQIHLFNFAGEGTFQNDGPFPDWVHWDEFLFDMSGKQEKQSRVFVDLLSTMTGAPVGPPRM